jgi:hypothetical protein
MVDDLSGNEYTPHLSSEQFYGWGPVRWRRWSVISCGPRSGGIRLLVRGVSTVPEPVPPPVGLVVSSQRRSDDRFGQVSSAAKRSAGVRSPSTALGRLLISSSTARRCSGP